MQQIRDAILSGDRSQETYAGLAIPASYRAVTVHKDEVEMFEGLASRDKDPRKSLHVDEVPVPSLPPARRWWRSWRAPSTTTPSGPRSSSRSRPSASSSATAAPRRTPSATTCPTTSSAPTSPAWCCGPAPASTKWKPGQEVVAHCLSVELESADGHNDTMLDPEQRIWGFETNFGGLAELAIVKSQPADAQARPPDVGGGCLPRPGEQHGLPPARSRATAQG